jgi:hypothetical protein
LHQSRASGRVLNFIGAMSGPVTMKSPLTTRMVSVVIARPLLFGCWLRPACEPAGLGFHHRLLDLNAPTEAGGGTVVTYP